MKILFVTGELGYIDPIAIGFLSAIAKERGHDTFFCSLDIHDFGDMISRIAPDIIAYSCFSSDIAAFTEENKNAKFLGKFVSIIGGAHPTFSVQETLALGFDAVVIGEGEYTFRDFLSRIEASQPFDDVDGLVTPNNPEPKMRPLIQNIDELPLPDRDLVLGSTVLGNTSKKTFFSSRGCPYQCTYCLNPALQKLYRGQGKFIRRFSVDRVIEEITDIKSKYRLEFIKFDDDVFATRANPWLQEFAQKYKEQIGLPFNCLLRLDHAKDDLLDLLKEAGCHSITTSIDSASERVRREILNRKMSNDIIIERIKKIGSHGIKSFVNFILDLPLATIDDELASIEMAREAGVTYLSYTFLTLFPGAKITDYCIANDLVHNDYKPPRHMLGEPVLDRDPNQIRIKKNIMDLGHLAMASPEDMRAGIVRTIRHSPHMQGFSELRKNLYRYYMEKVIYTCEDNIEL